MKSYLIPAVGFLLSTIFLFGCGKENKDEKRIQTLNAMPVLYESTLIVAKENDPALTDFLIPMDDSYDPNLVQAMKDDYHTANYIPRSILAITAKQAKNDELKRPGTIKIGDKVSVLAQADSGAGRIVYLVRTTQNTYGWIYAMHLQDKDGKRITEFKPM